MEVVEPVNLSNPLNPLTLHERRMKGGITVAICNNRHDIAPCAAAKSAPEAVTAR